MHATRGLLLTAVILCAGAAAPLSAQGPERIHLKDGGSLTGIILGPSADGALRVRVGDHVVEVTPDSIYTVVPVAEDAAVASPVTRSAIARTTADVLDELGRRERRAISPEDARIFSSCLAEVTRNHWDTAIQSARVLQERAPGWADPQILRAQLLCERGDERESLAVALYLVRSHPDDELGLRVAAECYRRAGFPRLAAELADRILDGALGRGPALAERTRVWWSVDPERALESWRQYCALDPDLHAIPEGHALRRARRSLAVGDWQGAQAVCDDLTARAPWMRAEIGSLRGEILEARLQRSQADGAPEESLLALAALAAQDPTRAQEWNERRRLLVDGWLERGLALPTSAEFGEWVTRYGHLFADLDTARRRISAHQQELALNALAAGELDEARSGFVSARRWHAEARPADLDAQLERVEERLQEDLRLRRQLRFLHAVELIRVAFPERAAAFQEDLVALVRRELGPVVDEAELSRRLDEVRGVFARDLASWSVEERRRSAGHSAQIGGSTGTTGAEPSIGAREARDVAPGASALLGRYYPHEIGARWVYRTHDGNREERRLEDLQPVDGGGWRATIRVTTEPGGESFTTSVYFVGGEVREHAREVPPGEIALRYPLTPGQSWLWEKGNLRFQRTVQRIDAPLHLPTGTVEDAVIVQGTNSIVVDGDDERYRTWKRVTYAAGIGVVRIEAEAPELERTLIEYVPGRSRSSELGSAGVGD